jgi:hypothetical protein
MREREGGIEAESNARRAGMRDVRLLPASNIYPSTVTGTK